MHISDAPRLTVSDWLKYSYMSWSPENSIIIGISSRALFNLDEEDKIYREGGAGRFIQYQRDHENEILSPGVAFSLTKALLGLNEKLSSPSVLAVEVVVVSQNHPDCSIRIDRSLKHFNLTVKRAVFTGGQDTLPFLRALQVDLFLSKDENAVRNALQAGIPAGLVFGGAQHCQTLGEEAGTPVLAFDGDAVLFSDEAEKVFRDGGMEAFHKSESENRLRPMSPGPLHKFASALSELQGERPIDDPPFRIALVTARDLAYCERPIRTLREWGMRMDQAFFVSDMSKRIILAALNPLIFFDDSSKHCSEASTCTPTVHIPAPPNGVEAGIGIASPEQTSIGRPARFLAACKLVLKKDYSKSETELAIWYECNAQKLEGDSSEAFLDELERSVRETPSGFNRRAASARNSSSAKMMGFLRDLFEKHSRV